MRVVLQRVREASVVIEGREHARIGAGYVVLLGVKNGDTTKEAISLADRCSSLRVIEDGDGKMNLGLAETGGSVLVVSQFTLYGNAEKGNRPSFTDAATPAHAEPLYETFVKRLRSTLGDDRVATGVFRSMMDIHLINNGPVTILLEN
jgi:D-tyrosyl-tRNA(Tyr) deacylase